jgi:hypothetical protein
MSCGSLDTAYYLSYILAGQSCLYRYMAMLSFFVVQSDSVCFLYPWLRHAMYVIIYNVGAIPIL